MPPGGSRAHTKGRRAIARIVPSNIAKGSGVLRFPEPPLVDSGFFECRTLWRKSRGLSFRRPMTWLQDLPHTTCQTSTEFQGCEVYPIPHPFCDGPR